MRTLLIIVIILIGTTAQAADTMQVIRIMPMQARLFNIDESGNIYIVRADNTLTRFTDAGDSSAFYRSITNGNIGTVDATNPLQVTVYFPDFSKAVILDRMLTPKADIDLRKLNITSPTAVANSADGMLWVYDPFNARLRKVDEELNIRTESNDLRQQISFVPAPNFMVERDRRLYVCDSANGILIFDQYATYINTLPIYGLKYLQAFGQQIVYRQGDTLHSYNLESFRDKIMLLPQSNTPILQAAFGRNALYVLYADKLILFRRPQD